MIYILIAYLLIGLVVYAVSDTPALARRIADVSVVVPYGVAEKYLFLFVVALWPVWVVANLKAER